MRYPDFSDEPLTQEFLHIFNRLSGSADEMGSFVTRLSTAVNAYRKQKDDAMEESATVSSLLNQKIGEIESMSSKNAELQSKLKELREIEEQRRRNPYASNLDDLLKLSLSRELSVPVTISPRQPKK